MHSAEDWQSMKRTFTQNMATLSSYLQKWKRKLSSLPLRRSPLLSTCTARRQLVSLRLLPKVASCPFLLSQLISALRWTGRSCTAKTWSHCAKNNNTRWSFEGPSGIKLGSWCQSVAHSFLGFDSLCCRVLCSFLKSKCSHAPP